MPLVSIAIIIYSSSLFQGFDSSAALDFDISAIAIATDYRNSLLQWTVRSFANDMMRSSWFPVLLFSPKK